MNKLLKKFHIFIFPVLIVCTAIFMICSCFLLYQEQIQNKKIEKLESSILSLQNTLASKDSVAFSNNCSGGYNYLAIGNSITKHSICDYWWTESGMAASKTENDYFHKTVHSLEDIYGSVNGFAYNFAIWESQSSDRAEAVSYIEGFFNENIDLVTVQLGENVVDSSTFESDLQYLVSYIQDNCPEAQIIIIGNFWADDQLDLMKQSVADVNHTEYLSLSEIQNKDYYCGIGTVIEDDKGIEHIVNHNGVAKHPNDKAMEYIAKSIINRL